jgi:hypothetical protein
MTRRQWREKLRAESHKVVARVLGLPLQTVHDRFEHERKVRRRWVAGSVAAAVALGWGIWAWSEW